MSWFKRRLKFDFGELPDKQPTSFSVAVRMCESLDNPTPEAVAEIFYCLGALEGLRSGTENPAEGELFLAQMKKQIGDQIDDFEKGQ